ncbi:MAG: bifunctional enoyl-CoA hydratase/phosphate acetyltransferase [Metallibacterium scheffleri]|uniref:bifunctional enoyl-CoA hydratase/phosphate acetyltransferase n=1 Tax=Metallibacterium scheffleri TaxID=993689 RepID=UPI0026E931B8|nr:bifunctional enoyl-CoA hydratase/phosphate acetyltransferase [Metallibacterium scheffleri]MCK9365634.1 bifunctional enoyl-CoA hydratase/phosphate acetyltransferase [Metallibacterium scheffleri]
MTEMIENRPLAELRVGDTASLTRTFTQGDVETFALMSGDVNPSHVDATFAASDRFHEVVAHGMWSAALISTVLGTELPGPGTVYLDQSLKFRKPVFLGDSVRVTVTVSAIDAAISHIPRATLRCEVINQRNEIVVEGDAQVIVPTEKISRPRVHLPKLELRDPGVKLRALVEQARVALAGHAPLVMAVVHAVDAVSLGGAVDAAQAGLITPVFVGPEARIRAAAEAAHIDIAPYRLIATEHSHAAAAQAVAMARSGEVQALMKGSLHTDELMHAVVDAQLGLRTARRVSHVFVIDAVNWPTLQLLTDAAVNVFPDLEAKRDIVQNAIDLAHALGMARPKVAILSAVETVTPKIPSTIDAAALCKMADRGQITGGVLDGPLAFDNAVSAAAAKTKGIVSPVAGHADILVAPDLEAGNMLAKQLEYLAEAKVAGIVLGARVPVVLTSRADLPDARMASCALAVLLSMAVPAEKAG